jgi:hypothetical protein
MGVIGASVFPAPPLLSSMGRVQRGGRILSVNAERSAPSHRGSSAAVGGPKVALTREVSKNHFLHDLILKNKLQCEPVLLPVLQHSSRLGDTVCYDQFCRALAAADVVVLSSPQVYCFLRSAICYDIMQSSSSLLIHSHSHTYTGCHGFRKDLAKRRKAGFKVCIHWQENF